MGPVKEIEVLVDMGFYMNTADFVGQAVREKLDTLEVLEVRTVSKEKAEQEILDYLKNHARALSQ